jgi:hypothetical protein
MLKGMAPKGHFPEDLHIALVELVRELIPEGTKVVFLGDGEFDGIKLQETMHEAGWDPTLTPISTFEPVHKNRHD